MRGDREIENIHECRSFEKGDKTRLAVILAGGMSRRMGGDDKAEAMLAGERLVDRVARRLQAQAGRLLISGAKDYGTGLQTVPDLTDGPRGPVAGIFAIAQWLRCHAPEAEEFFTLPVDAPFAPADLVERLAAAGGTAIASDGDRDHPTFARWRLDSLAIAWPKFADQPSPSLKALAEACGAFRVVWSEPRCFLNLNTKQDLIEAARFLESLE